MSRRKPAAKTDPRFRRLLTAFRSGDLTSVDAMLDWLRENGYAWQSFAQAVRQWQEAVEYSLQTETWKRRQSRREFRTRWNIWLFRWVNRGFGRLWLWSNVRVAEWAGERATEQFDRHREELRGQKED
jgi:hypothetical protein